MASATYSAKVDANGDATITIRTPSIRSWTIAQVTVELQTAPAGATCNLRKNGYLVSPMIPTADVAAGEPKLLLDSTDTLTIEWENCTPDDIAKAQLFYLEV